MKFLSILLLYALAIRFLCKFGVTQPLIALFICSFASMSLIAIVLTSGF